MAAKQPNLKVNVNSDTSGFTKGMSQAKKELGAFEKATSDASSKLASAFGINTAQVEKLQNAFAGLGRKMSESGKEGSAALGQIIASAGKAATAIGAIGIGAAVTAFKLLNEEAESFKNTIQGANIELQTQAYLNTYRQAIHDYNEGIGKSMAETEAEVKKWWGRIWQNIKTGAVTAITQPVFSGSSTLANTFANAWTETGKAAEYAAEKAETAGEIQGVIYSLTRKQADASREWADAEAKIAELRRTASDPEESTLRRTQALAEAKELIKKKQAEQYDLQLMISNLTDYMSEQASDSIEDANAANAAYVSAVQNLAAMDAELKALTKQQSSLTKLAQSEAQARKETAAAIQKGVERMQEYATAQVEMFVSEDSINAIQNKLGEALAQAPVQVPVGLDIAPAEQSILDLTETIQSTLVEAVEGIAEAFGNLIANLAMGEGGMADFGQDILNMFGTFAQKFGKVLVAFGVAAEAARHAIANPLAAIAAGAALIAVGAAVKAVASNMASSMGSAATSGGYVASSAVGGNMGYSDRTLQVEVTGTLTANGSQLVAVLNNENTRKSYTT